jgi:hypothetical protein
MNTELITSQVEDMLLGRMEDEDILQVFAQWEKMDATPEHLVAAAQAMRDVMSPVELPGDPVM